MSQSVVGAILEALKDTPVIVGGGAVLFGVPVSTLVVCLTLLWAFARVVEVGLNIYWKWKDRNEQGK